ncbi:hypothetical protein EDD85DRAFT_774334, partial [Armillaria nabsnona]
VGEGHCIMLWIWLVEGGLRDGSEKDMIEAVRAGWLKSYAPVLQWSEELQLVEEEMRWVQVSLAQKVDWWEKRCGSWQPLTPQSLEGIVVYADKQVTLICRFVVSFSMLWGEEGDFDKDEWINEEDAKSDMPVENRGCFKAS